MKLSAELQGLSAKIGHSFAKPSLLVEAVTHSSMSSPTRSDNQRLEFLGDRVLGLVISEELLRRDPEASEGLLAPRFNALVRKEACAAVAEQISLGASMRLGRSEMLSGGRKKAALLGDAMEALIAAIYLDAGFDTARDIILRLWKPMLEDVKLDARDAKTTLQEWAQARGLQPPKYTLTGRSGPDHAPIFEITAELTSGEATAASAGSKRQAEQEAARAMLTNLKVDT